MGLLRFLLALSVVAHHTPSHSFVMLDASVAVIIFFMISGFYMAFVIGERYSHTASWQGRFYLSRLGRIFPAYWTVLLFGVAWFLFNSNATVFTANLQIGYWKQITLILTNVFLVGQDLLYTIAYSLNANAHNPASTAAVALYGKEFFQDKFIVVGQAWSLGTELLFYMIAPFLVVKIRRLVLFLTISLAIRAFISWKATFFPPLVWGYNFFPSTLIFFCLGSLGYFLYKKVEFFHWSRRFGQAAGLAVVIGFTALAFLGGAFYNVNSFDSIGHWIFYLSAAILIPFLFLASKSNKYDRAIGELSYPLYLVHGFVIGIVFEMLGLRRGELATELVGMACSVFVAALLYYFVDKPVDRFRKGFEMIDIRPLSRKIILSVAIGLAVAILLGIGLQYLRPSNLPPMLVSVQGRYNIVSYDRKFFAVPQGTEINWEKGNVENMSGVYVAGSAERVIALVPKSALVEPPMLIQVVGHYNIVRYQGKYFGIPQGIEINWDKDNVAAIPGVFVDNSQEAVRVLASNAVAPASEAPMLVQVVGNYNIVHYRDKYFAIPQGIEINWEKDDVPGIPGVFVDGNKDQVISKIPNTATSSPPVLIEVVGTYNIVRYKDKYFAIPQGIAVNWEKDKVDEFPGVKVSDKKDSLLKLLNH